MFRLINRVFHVTRGDYGSFDFSIQIRNEEGHVKYKDNNSKVYWYDPINKILYDDSYEVSNIDIKTLTMELYIFNVGDVIRFKVFKEKGCECVEIQKDFKVTEETTKIEISLEKEDTKIGELIKKPKNYWYEIELNPDTRPQTVVGYDLENEKLFVLYPEGGEKK